MDDVWKMVKTVKVKFKNVEIKEEIIGKTYLDKDIKAFSMTIGILNLSIFTILVDSNTSEVTN